MFTVKGHMGEEKKKKKNPPECKLPTDRGAMPEQDHISTDWVRVISIRSNAATLTLVRNAHVAFECNIRQSAAKCSNVFTPVPKWET